MIRLKDIEGEDFDSKIDQILEPYRRLSKADHPNIAQIEEIYISKLEIFENLEILTYEQEL